MLYVENVEGTNKSFIIKIMKKYSIEGYQSCTHWIKMNGKNLFHCGYWSAISHQSLLCQRNSYERNRFIHSLVDGLNKIVEVTDYKPYVWIPVVDYSIKGYSLTFHDALFGDLELECKKIEQLKWLDMDIPKEFLSDLELLVSRVKICDLQD